ncbi:MAG: dihydroorotate dehydrogenase electron transfer subunit [Oscillospiraceae bacterium]
MSASYYKSKVLENECVQDNIYRLKVLYPTARDNLNKENDGEGKPTVKLLPPKPGQFFMLRCWGKDEAPLLSRPISVNDFEKDVLTFLYEVKGIGTEKIADLKKDDLLQLTGGCGNGFPLDKIKGKVAIVSGGIGIAPLLYLAKSLQNCTTDLFCGFRDKSYETLKFENFVNKISVATDTGNEGKKGFVTDLFDVNDYDVVVTCGPEIMMEKLAKNCLKNNVTVYVSKEGKMACGIGACLGCTCKTKNGGKSVCKDGPVFEGSEVYDVD